MKAKLAEIDAATQSALQEGFKNHYIGLANSYNDGYMKSKEAEERQIGIFFCRLEYENINLLTHTLYLYELLHLVSLT